MEDVRNSQIIDLREIVQTLWQRRRVFYRVLIIAFIIACVWIFPQPRYYRCEVSLAPEAVSASAMGSLGSIASSFGFDLGENGNDDAIYPLLYPDVMSSSDFIVSLFGINVKTSDGEIDTDYYDYMSQHQKICIWDYPKRWAKKGIKKIRPKKKTIHIEGENNGVNPFSLTEDESSVVKKVDKKLLCKVDKKTMVITVSLTDQDPLIAATMADSVRVRLQNLITDYRTNKARIDEEHYKKLTEKALEDYTTASKKYANYADSHLNSITQKASNEAESLQNEMQQAYTIYTAYQAQLQAAQARVQERTPAFTVIQGATIPLKPAGPKRMIFVIGMCFFACVAAALWLVRKQLFPQW